MSAGRQWAAYRFAMVMVALGTVLGGLAIWLYLITPRANSFAAPPFTEVSIASTVKVSVIAYQISRPDPPVREEVTVDLIAADPSAAGSATARLTLPHGKAFRDCSGCGPAGSMTASFVHGHASYHWTVNGTRLAWDLNLDTADAVLPQMIYSGPGDPLLAISYRGIRDASTYDWNTLATSLVRGDEVDWTVPVTNGFAQAQVATGVDHGVDHILANNGLITAALVGASAGALLAAVQEIHQVSRSAQRQETVADAADPPDPPDAI